MLQVSEIAKQQGDHSVSGDLLERALFSFGRSVHSSFAAALSEGKARLDFGRPENREFWLAAWRYISNIGQRGTWRTAYEWAKLLLSLSPDNDPYRVSWILDQLALRGGQEDHLLKLGKCTYYQTKWKNHPNIEFSSALAEYKAKEAAKCRLSLAKAVKKYPWIVARLFKELNIEPIPKSVWGKEPRSKREKLECEIYVLGAKDLWSNPDATSLLVEVTGSVTVDDIPPVKNGDMTIDEARHVFLTGIPALFSLMPRSFTNASISSSDPFPPTQNKVSYSFDPLANSETSQNSGRPLQFDILPDLPPDTEPPNSTPRSADQQEEDMQELRGLQNFFSRVIPQIAPSSTNQGTDQESRTSIQQQIFNYVRTETGPSPAILAARGMRLIQLLRRTLGRDPRAGELLPNTGDPLPANEAPNDISFSPPPDSTESPSSNASLEDEEQQHSSLVPEPYDDDRNQRWLAGQGMLRLRDFATAHGTDEAAWTGDSDVANEGRQLVTEYARRVLRLQRDQTRRFILDYVLRQGTSVEVRELVVRHVTLLGG